MAVDIVIPEVGEISSEVTFVRWQKKEGDRVSEGDELFEVDTEKSVFTVEAFADGYLAELAAEGGESVSPGQVVGRLLTEEEWASRHEQVPTDKADDVTARVVGSARGANAAGRRVSPRARRIARERGVDLEGIEGTGAGGIVTERDVERATSPAGTAPSKVGPAVTERMAKVRRAVAERTTSSWQSIPHFTLRLDVDATVALLKLKPMLLVASAMTRALRDHPECNLEWRGSELAQRSSVDFGLLVDAPDGLLLTTVRGAEAMTLVELDLAIEAAVGRAREGRLQPIDYSSHSATISNLGMYSVDGFIGVIPAPDCMLLAVGRARSEARWIDGKVQERRIIPLALSIDHRALDGAAGARLLTALERHVTVTGAHDA